MSKHIMTVQPSAGRPATGPDLPERRRNTRDLCRRGLRPFQTTNETKSSGRRKRILGVFPAHHSRRPFILQTIASVASLIQALNSCMLLLVSTRNAPYFSIY